MAAAQGTGLPEFLVAASAENSAYASLLAQESPTVRKIEHYQKAFRRDFRRIIEALTGSADFTISIPPVVSRDIKETAEAYGMLYDRQILSRKTYCEQLGIDWDGPDGEKVRLADDLTDDGGFVPPETEMAVAATRDVMADDFAAAALRSRLRTNRDEFVTVSAELMDQRGKAFAVDFMSWVMGRNGHVNAK